MTERNATAYLQRVLRLNPLFEAEKVIAERKRFLGIVDLGEAAAAENQELRTKVSRKINQIRGAFWTGGAERLQRQLSSLPVDKFPDLKATVERLLRVLDIRPEFPQLLDHPSTVKGIFSAFKDAATASRKEAARIRQATLPKVNSSNRRRRAYKMARRVKRQFPELYELDRQWWDHLLRMKPSRLQRPVELIGMRDNMSSLDATLLGLFLWGVLLVVLTVSGFVAYEILAFVMDGS